MYLDMSIEIVINDVWAQLTDVAQLGSVEEVTKLIVPPGSQVLAREAAKKALPPRDTGTIRGVVQLPPQTAYRSHPPWTLKPQSLTSMMELHVISVTEHAVLLLTALCSSHSTQRPHDRVLSHCSLHMQSAAATADGPEVINRPLGGL